MSTNPASATPRHHTPRWSPRRVAVAALVGTAIEYYDFFIYGTAAALVLGPQFFPATDPVTGTLAAFATFAVGFLARPLGGVVMGHYGDRVGRKNMLVLSLLVMGIATVLIGLLPTYAMIGVAAPALLVLLRFVQGFGVGGELGGAVLMSFEHAPRHRRALYGAFPMMGLPAGIILSTLVFLVVQAAVPAEAFAVWGWRIPFLLAVVLVALGMLLRARIAETPEFTAAKAKGEVRRAPLLEVVATAPRELAAGSLAMIAGPALSNIILVFLLSYGTATLGLPSSTMLTVIVLSAVVWFGTIALTGLLADRIGRKPVFAFGCLLGAVWAFPLFALVNTRSFPLMLLGAAVGAIACAIVNGTQGALLSEAFPTHLRYSGFSIVVQIGTLLGAAISPFVSAVLMATTGTAYSIAAYAAAMALISLVAVAALRTSPHRFADPERLMTSTVAASTQPPSEPARGAGT